MVQNGRVCHECMCTDTWLPHARRSGRGRRIFMCTRQGASNSNTLDALGEVGGLQIYNQTPFFRPPESHSKTECTRKGHQEAPQTSLAPPPQRSPEGPRWLPKATMRRQRPPKDASPMATPNNHETPKAAQKHPKTIRRPSKSINFAFRRPKAKGGLFQSSPPLIVGRKTQSPTQSHPPVPLRPDGTHGDIEFVLKFHFSGLFNRIWKRSAPERITKRLPRPP